LKWLARRPSALRQQRPDCFGRFRQAPLTTQQFDRKRNIPVAAADADQAAVAEIAFDGRQWQPGHTHALQRQFLEQENQGILKQLVHPHLCHATRHFVVDRAADERSATIGQVGQRRAGSGRQRVARCALALRGAHRNQRLIADFNRFKVFDAGRARQRRMAIRQGQIGLAGGITLGKFVDRPDRTAPDQWPDFAIQARQQRRKNAGRAGGGHEEGNRRCGIGRIGTDRGAEVEQGLDTGHRDGQHLLAGGGQFDRPRAAIEQGCANPFLQRLDAPAEGGLGDMPLHRRAGKAAAAHQRQKILQPVEFHDQAEHALPRA